MGVNGPAAADGLLGLNVLRWESVYRHVLSPVFAPRRVGPVPKSLGLVVVFQVVYVERIEELAEHGQAIFFPRGVDLGLPSDPLHLRLREATVQAEMRPYQKSGFDFLCHLTSIRLGGILADDMGLGKTLQTLAWLAWLFVHLMYLVEFENRVLVLIQWGWNYVTRNRSARLITERNSEVRRCAST